MTLGTGMKGAANAIPPSLCLIRAISDPRTTGLTAIGAWTAATQPGEAGELGESLAELSLAAPVTAWGADAPPRGGFPLVQAVRCSQRAEPVGRAFGIT